MKYNTGCKYFDNWFELCDKQPTSIWNLHLRALILKKIEKQHIYVDVKKVDKLIKTIEKYRPYKLAPVQKFLHCIPYTYLAPGIKAWNEILIESGRGFGKNAYVSDYILGATSNVNGIKGYNVDIVATSEDQAKTSFTDVYNAIGDNTDLQRAYKRTLVEIEFVRTNSKVKYYTSNAKTKDGLRPGAVVFDEIHAYEDYDNIKVFRSALGKVPEPLTIYITTNGYVRGGVLDDLVTEGKECLLEQDLESKLFPFIAVIDRYEEWDDPSLWVKANPMIPYLPILEQEYKDAFRNAKKRPHMKVEFITKRLNFTMEDTDTAVASWEDILATNQEVNWKDFMGCSCVGGVDYASSRDFIGVGLLFKKIVNDNTKYYFKHHTFIVEESLKLVKFKVDLDRAISEGLVTIVPGKTMDPRYLTSWFLNEVKENRYIIEAIATDDYRYELIKDDFNEVGLPLTTVRSGPISHGKIAPIIEKLFADNNLVFGDDMMMRWYTNNVKVVTDGKGNKTYQKQDPERRKTDGFMAFIHAMLKRDSIRIATLSNINKGFKTYTY